MENMNIRLFTAMLTLILSGAAAAQDSVPAHPYIEIDTSEGRVLLELDGRAAPITVGHFLSLVDAGFFDGLIFHRVIEGFMVQGGGYTPGLKLKEDERSIPNESGNGLANARGSVAMARTSDPHSANSQFFINVADNFRLDPNKTPGGGSWGYTVFGRVIEGMEVIDAIAAVPTGVQQGMRDVPQIPIIIKSAKRYTFE
jgi:cyclophilin family peptidyl-prolyl cis-trans isomerase